MRDVIAVAALMVVATASPSWAQTCASMLDELEAAAQERGQPLTGSAGGLAGSDGVIAAPPVGTMPTYTPPDEAGGGMPTAPEIRPQTRSGTPAPATAAEAAETAQVEALVTAARDAALRGDETACQERLDEVLGLIDPEFR